MKSRRSRRSHRKSRRSHRKSRRSRRSHRKSRRSHRKSRRSHRKSRRSPKKKVPSKKERVSDIVGIYVEYSVPSKKAEGKWKKLSNAKHARGWYYDGGDAGGKVGGKTKFGAFWIGPKSSKDEMKRRLREYYNSAKKNGFVKSFVLK